MFCCLLKRAVTHVYGVQRLNIGLQASLGQRQRTGPEIVHTVPNKCRRRKQGPTVQV
jgi:hypothetical protein